MSQSSGSILVIRGGAIGDFILTLPVLAALRAQLPGARIEVLGYAHIARLAEAGGLADAVRSIEARAMAGFFARNGTLSEELQEYFAGFAVVISYLYDPDEIFRSNVARCSKAQFIQGPHRPDDSSGIHATEVFLRPLERLAIFDADPVPRLNFAPTATERGRVLAAHPGSGSERKNWPEGKWAAFLADFGATTDLDLLLVGGEAEGQRLERLAAHWPSGRRQIARSLPLPGLAARLRGCAAFVGHDSGITHLAAAVGLRGLALWGATPEAVWRPRGDGMQLVRASGGLGTLPVTRVASELRMLLGRML